MLMFILGIFFNIFVSLSIFNVEIVKKLIILSKLKIYSDVLLNIVFFNKGIFKSG